MTARRGGYGRIQVDGAKQLRRGLKQVGIDVTADLREANLAVARMVDAAADRDPLRPRVTGALDATSRATGTQREAVIKVGRARVPYAGPIHWGWTGRGIESQPWVYRAVRQHEEDAYRLYLQYLERIIDKIEGTHTP